MKRLRSFKEILELKESSIVGKGVAIGQMRNHAATKTKYLGILSQIQNDCKQGISEDDIDKRSNLQFQILSDLTRALKLLADLSTNTNNIAATAVLDAENIQKELSNLLGKFKLKYHY